MCKVTKAYAMCSEDKALAIDIYECSVVELANKNYKRDYSDAFIELSAIFGQNWLYAKGQGFGLEEAKQANNAFNYANLQLGAQGRFAKTAKRLLSAYEIASKQVLRDITKEMNALLTNV